MRRRVVVGVVLASFVVVLAGIVAGHRFGPAPATAQSFGYGFTPGFSAIPTTMTAALDNTYDIGATSTRWRSAYLGTSLLVNTTAASGLHADATSAVGAPPFTAISNGGTNIQFVGVQNGANTSPGQLAFLKTRSATGSDADTAVASGDDISTIRAYAADGATYREVARILSEVQTYTGSDNVSGRMIFYTRPTGAAASLTAALTLDEAQVATFASTVVTTALKTSTALITAADGSSNPSFLANSIAATGGPTTATQNGWVKMLDSAGATVWVPVWK